MKQIFILLFALLFIAAGCAPVTQEKEVESSPLPSAEPSASLAPAADMETTMMRINAMAPAFDSIIRTIGIDSNITYAPKDEQFFWSVMYLMGVNWGFTNPLVTTSEDYQIIIPRKVMQEFATAAFMEYSDLLPIPESYTEAVRYDEGMDAYYLMASDSGDTMTMLEAVNDNGDGTYAVTVGLYFGDGERLGGIVFSIADNPYVSGITEPTFYYSVTGAINEVANGTATWQEADLTNGAQLECDGTPNAATATLEIGEEDACTLTIKTASNEFTEAFDYFYNVSAHIADTVREDGFTELYISGDTGSDDYVTYIYRIEDGKLEKESINGTVLSAFGNGTVSVNTVINILGTYGATCNYAMSPDFAFTLASDYTVMRSPDDWEYKVITLKRDGLPVTWANGETESIKSGAEFLLTATDDKSYVLLESKDGRIARVELTADEDEYNYTEWKIYGTVESEWFTELRYAG